MRFPGFEDEWEKEKLGKLIDFKVTNSFSRDKLNYENGTVKNIHYGDIHKKFQTLLDVNNESIPFINDDVHIDKISKDCYCKEGDVIFADASEDLNDVGKSIEVLNLNDEELLSGLHTLLGRPSKNIFHIGFLGYLLKSNSARLQIKKEAQGSKVLSINVGRISKINLFYPVVEEQKNIRQLLFQIDQRILTQSKIIKDYKLFKKGMMQKLFKQEVRFKDEDGKFYPKWEKKKLQEILNYEQPTKYLVADTEYDDEYKTPVLTAGKTFLLGYTNEENGVFKDNLPTIIFDDFTTAFQYVDFPFKAKSSAMKMLIPKEENINLKFVFEAMKTIKFPLAEHKRYWISEYQNEKIPYPCIKEQKKIAEALSAIDAKIDLEMEILAQLNQQKQYFSQNLFI